MVVNELRGPSYKMGSCCCIVVIICITSVFLSQFYRLYSVAVKYDTERSSVSGETYDQCGLDLQPQIDLMGNRYYYKSGWTQALKF